MALFRDNPGELNYIRTIDERGACVRDQTHELPLIVSPRDIRPAPACSSKGHVADELLEAVFELGPEIVILGTGKEQHFLAPETMMQFHRRGVGIEVMKTRPACRTFNILVVEERQVVAVLMPLD